MENRLSQKDLGGRIVELRKLKGLSQSDLSKALEISRSSVAQIELGNRNISVLELIKLSEILGFSMDKFLAKDYQAVEEVVAGDEAPSPSAGFRISIPNLKVEKFKNVLLYILERCAGKPNVGETVLYKLLYFCDFNYYETYEEHLTGAEYRKLPYGPVPQKLDSVLKSMIDNRQLMRFKSDYHGFLQSRFLPLEKADLRVISGAEKDIIDQVIDRFSDWSATAISDYSHKDIPWKASGEGEVIDYELAFYREPPFSARVYDDEPTGS